MNKYNIKDDNLRFVIEYGKIKKLYFSHEDITNDKIYLRTSRILNSQNTPKGYPKTEVFMNESEAKKRL